MRQTSYLIIYILLIFCSCVQQDNTDKNISQDHSQNNILEKEYQAIDTVVKVTEKELSMYGEPYVLKINRYCLNDSGIEAMVQTDTASKKTHKFLHNYAEEIKLTKNNKVIFSKQITKNLFWDSLGADFYNNCRLKDIQYDFVRTNRLYFDAILADTDSDSTETMKFAIFYKTEKLGQLDYWKGGPTSEGK